MVGCSLLKADLGDGVRCSIRGELAEEVEPPTLLPEGAIFAGGDKFEALSCSCWMYSGKDRTSMISDE